MMYTFTSKYDATKAIRQGLPGAFIECSCCNSLFRRQGLAKHLGDEAAQVIIDDLIARATAARQHLATLDLR